MKINAKFNFKLLFWTVRLVGNSSINGRVEILYNGIWGTVCNKNWDLQDANVVCREVGYAGALAAVRYAADIYGLGKGAIWMADVDCKGNETSLLECNQSKIGESYCGHDDDAGVICIAQGNFFYYFSFISTALQ